MHEKITTPWPSLKGLWSLLWRATVLAPLAAILMVGYLAVWVGVFLLPVRIIYHLWQAEWLLSFITVAIWIPLFLLARWKGFRIDSRDILNDQENL